MRQFSWNCAQSIKSGNPKHRQPQAGSASFGQQNTAFALFFVVRRNRYAGAHTVRPLCHTAEVRRFTFIFQAAAVRQNASAFYRFLWKTGLVSARQTHCVFD
ncbi:MULTISPECIES: hypothetical protein [unclassified Neisseria]|uniref:hypothetical protein n=1 Tax=unclassified Neisseria TaxID=2623750 RepID=UPI001071890E|nr:MULTISPECIES: hypothetical protein [unclassified Neisseria]MBF0803251.1 hypothetical protein [Neisseria sp. 19428wB4_WF04]TFU44090.1 hypothetical protein E4T99_02580 [Neisseria sp. WF04]